MTSTTELDATGAPAARLRSTQTRSANWRERFRAAMPDARHTGVAVIAVGFACLTYPSLLATAFGVELLALAFWLWARAAPDPQAQIERWAWLRRPASAMWVAFALASILPDVGAGPQLSAVEPLRMVQAAALVWGGLELLAALPLTRTFSDLPGPYLDVRSWLPVLMPTTGFVVLWRHADLWADVSLARQAALALLLVTTVLATLRAFVRRTWTAALRWLVVIDCVLGAMLLAANALPANVTLLLWVAACGAHTFLLAGEMRSSSPRRGVLLIRLWRTASWTALACLAWPAAALNGPERAGPLGLAVRSGLAVAMLIAGWVVVGRMVRAEERRTVMRPEPVITLSHVMAVGILVLALTALGMAWWAGFEPPLENTLWSVGPIILGGWTAVLSRQQPPLRRQVERVVSALRGPARRIFELFVRLEAAIVAWVGNLTAALARPLQDLHTGDAQEYLLFLVGFAVLAVILQLLR